MADPLSATGVALQFATLIKQLYEYGKEVKSAQKDIVDLSSELTALEGVLADVETLHVTTSGSSHADLTKMLEAASTMADALSTKLRPRPKASHRVYQSLKWPFDRVEVEAVIAKIERLKSWFMLRLMTDDQAASRSIQADLQALKLTFQDDADERSRWQLSQSSQATCKLVAPFSPDNAHHNACKIWAGTESGAWFLDGAFALWLPGDTLSDRLMILSGKSGCGKTTILSQAIERARRYVTERAVTKIGYSYCMYNDDASQRLRNILGTWVVQVVKAKHLVERYKTHLAECKEVPTKELENCLATVTNPVVLFVDAINESSEMEELLDCIKRILARNQNIKCLATTTPLSKLMLSSTVIDVREDKVAKDIESYIDREIARHPILQAVPRASILDALLPSANGMFRWTACQVSALVLQRTPRLLQKALKDLPGSLDDTYANILVRVPEADRTFLYEALSWLCVSLRPLTLSELCEAVVLELEDTAIDDTCRLHPKHQLLDLCRGLVFWDEDTDIVTLAHSSVRDFLVGQSVRNIGARCASFAIDQDTAQLNIVRKSLTYLLLEDMRTWSEHALSTSQWIERYPLLDYACRNWSLHAVRCQRPLEEADLHLIDILLRTHRERGTFSAFTFWVRCVTVMNNIPDYFEDEHGICLLDDVLNTAEPLYYMASCSFEAYIKRMVRQGMINVSGTRMIWSLDQKCGLGSSTALHVACYRGSLETVKVLLEAGANPNFESEISGLSCLAAAKGRGREDDIVQLLLKHGATATERGRSWDRFSPGLWEPRRKSPSQYQYVDRNVLDITTPDTGPWIFDHDKRLNTICYNPTERKFQARCFTCRKS